MYVSAKPCEQKPCLHGGTCIDKGNVSSCVCPVGLGGPNCDKGMFSLASVQIYLHCNISSVLTLCFGLGLHGNLSVHQFCLSRLINPSNCSKTAGFRS